MKLGKAYSVPDDRLYPRVVASVGKIHDEFSTREADALLVAQLLGHSSIGGAFNSRVAAMTSYGVVDRKLGKIRVTDIGRKIVSPRDSSEKVDGIRSSLLNVALWERLYQDFTSKGARLPENFWSELARISGIPPGEAKGKADWVASAYQADLSYLRSAEKETPNGSGRISGIMRSAERTSSQTILEEIGGRVLASGSGQRRGQLIFVSQEDGIQLSVPRSSRHIGMLRTFIESALKAIDEELAADSKRRAAGARGRKKAKK